MRQLLQAADRLAEAAVKEMERRELGAQMNEAVLETLPERNVRGTRDWWGAFCRTNTGAHFLDSGNIYGRMYETPVNENDVYANVHHGILEYLSINTVDFLATNLDASDEIAIALEELLYWMGDNVWANESWAQTSNRFVESLYELVEMYRQDYPSEEEAIADVESYLNTFSPQHFHGPSKYDKTYGLPADWQETFPWPSLRLIVDEGHVDYSDIGSGYTYNYDTDLNQDIVYESVKVGNTCFVLVQAHCGADARGGFSPPVVARVYDWEYFGDMQVRLTCNECYSDWCDTYEYGRDIERSDVDRTVLIDSECHEDASGTVRIDRIRFMCPLCKEHNVIALSPLDY